VIGVAHEKFERVWIDSKRKPQADATLILNPRSCAESSLAEKEIILAEQNTIPDDPYEQLRVAIGAVFNSWMGRRAIDYRRIKSHS